MKVKLSNKECIFFICMIMLNKLIINLPNILITKTGTGTLMNLILVSIISFGFVFIINKSFKKFPNSDIIDISDFIGKKFLKTLISLFYIVLFFIIAFIFLVDFTNLLQRIYYQHTPKVFILLFFIIGILYSNLIGFKSISKMISFLFPIVVLSIFMCLLGTFEHFSIENLTPIFGYNYKTTFCDGLINIVSYSFFAYYYFLLPLLDKPENFSKINYISFFISFTLLFITIDSILTVFPASSISLSINPLYLLSRNVYFGDFLQRLDGLFILFWILSLLCYLSSLVFFISLIFNKLFTMENPKMLSYPLSISILGAALYPFSISNIHYFENNILKYLTLIVIFIISPLILLIGNIKFNRLKKKGFRNEIYKKE